MLRDILEPNDLNHLCLLATVNNLIKFCMLSASIFHHYKTVRNNKDAIGFPELSFVLVFPLLDLMPPFS